MINSHSESGSGSGLFTGETTIIHQDLWLVELAPSSLQRSELGNTIIRIFSRWDQRIREGILILNSLREDATFIKMNRNRPKRIYENTKTDFYEYRNGSERTSVGTQMDQNRLQLIPKRTSVGTRKGRAGYDRNNPNKSMYVYMYVDR